MIGRVVYGVLFCVVLPVALFAWARAMDGWCRLPAVHLPWLGWTLTLAGVGVMAWSMVLLRVKGLGLPMNAFPPTRRVETGPYAWVGHPIYGAFVVIVAGVSIAFGSPSGLWIVTPVAALGCAALVAGYEADDLRRRLGPRPSPPRMRLAANTPDPPDFWDRVSAYGLVLAPWLVLYEAIGHLPVPDAVLATTEPERAWPVLVWTELVYALVYPLVVLAPLVVRRRDVLRRFERTALTAMAIGFWFYLATPFVSPPRDFSGTGFLAETLRFERADGLNGRAAMPSFHVFWALTAASAWGTLGRAARVVSWTLAAGITVSCVTTGMHAVADLVGGVVLFAVSRHADGIWARLLHGATTVANAWGELRVGPARVLVHAVYAFIAASIGLAITGWLAGPGWRFPILAVAGAGLVGAAAWGQALEASSSLSRPFGYYGHLIGSAIALIIIAVTREGAWELAAAYATAAPVIQCLGRWRCLVQGCCHGRVIEGGRGVEYRDPRSRVCAFTPWRGRPLHATQVYSMLSNVVIAAWLLRLWSVGAPATGVCGISLLLAGTARFVEEHYRGEPQTRVVRGLRVYQWLAVASVLAGAVIMSIPGPPLALGNSLSATQVVDAAIVGVVYAFAMGVDFPGSSARLARLA